MCTVEYYSAIKKDEENEPCTDLDMIILSEIGWKEKKITYHLHLESNFESDTNELLYKTETDSPTLKTDIWLPKGKKGEWEGIG